MTELIKIEIELDPMDQERVQPLLDALFEALSSDETESAFKWKQGRQSKTSAGT